APTRPPSTRKPRTGARSTRPATTGLATTRATSTRATSTPSYPEGRASGCGRRRPCNASHAAVSLPTVPAPSRPRFPVLLLATMLLVPVGAILAARAWVPAPPVVVAPAPSAATAPAPTPEEDRTPEIRGRILDAD